ncbi:hypothetical protein C8Q78DRAFT_702484 [Trametes maxima]|nr:hypothetical protein C8Q78DRAFT_702484 [Trametes maxima]
MQRTVRAYQARYSVCGPGEVRSTTAVQVRAVLHSSLKAERLLTSTMTSVRPPTWHSLTRSNPMRSRGGGGGRSSRFPTLISCTNDSNVAASSSLPHWRPGPLRLRFRVLPPPPQSPRTHPPLPFPHSADRGLVRAHTHNITHNPNSARVRVRVRAPGRVDPVHASLTCLKLLGTQHHRADRPWNVLGMWKTNEFERGGFI